MRKIYFILLSVLVASPVFADDYVITETVEMPYLSQAYFKKMSKKKQIQWMASLQKMMPQLVNASPKKTALSLSFLSEAYAQVSPQKCIDLAGYTRDRASDGTCPAPQANGCESGQVQCANYIFGAGRRCVSGANITQSCVSSAAQPIEVVSYLNSNQEQSRQAWTAYSSVCSVGQPVSHCVTLNQRASELRLAGASEAIIPTSVAPMSPQQAAQLPPRLQRLPRTNFRVSAPGNAEAANDDLATEQVQAEAPVATPQRNTPVRIAGQYVTPAPARPVDPAPARPVEPAPARRAVITASEPRATTNPNATANRRQQPQAQANEDLSGVDGLAEGSCRTGTLTMPMNIGGGHDRKNFLSDSDVQRFFCSRRKLTADEIAQVRRIATQNTSRITTRSTRTSLTNRQDVEGLMRMLNRCIAQNQSEDYPTAEPTVSMSCQVTSDPRYPVCSFEGRPNQRGGYERGVTSRSQMGTIMNISGWQWCQVREVAGNASSASPTQNGQGSSNQ